MVLRSLGDRVGHPVGTVAVARLPLTNSSNPKLLQNELWTVPFCEPFTLTIAQPWSSINWCNEPVPKHYYWDYSLTNQYQYLFNHDSDHSLWTTLEDQLFQWYNQLFQWYNQLLWPFTSDMTNYSNVETWHHWKLRSWSSYSRGSRSSCGREIFPWFFVGVNGGQRWILEGLVVNTGSFIGVLSRGSKH